MAGTRTLTITLPEELAQKIDAKVASGEFASESSYIAAQLDGWDDQETEAWLRQEVVPILDRCHADPSRLLTSEQVRESLQETYARTVHQKETRTA